MDIKQRLRQGIENPHSVGDDSEKVIVLCQAALASIETRETCAALLKTQSERILRELKKGASRYFGDIDMEALAGDLKYASRRSLGEDS